MSCKKTDHFTFTLQNAVILTTAVSGSMDRQAMIKKWTCIFCNTTKSASRLDWMCLPCDHLICLSCFRSRKPLLQSTNKCPSCDNQLPLSFTAFTWLITHQQAAYDDERRENDVNELE